MGLRMVSTDAARGSSTVDVGGGIMVMRSSARAVGYALEVYRVEGMMWVGVKTAGATDSGVWTEKASRRGVSEL